MSGYVFIKKNTINTSGAMRSAYAHNCDLQARGHLDNINHARTYLNYEMLNVPEGKTYEDAYNELKQKYNLTTYHKNDTKLFEIIANYTPQSIKASETAMWCEKTKKFLQDYFGKENVLSVYVHHDESQPHIHAIVIPLDENHKLKPSKWFTGKASLWRFKKTYAEYVKEFGLMYEPLAKRRPKREALDSFNNNRKEFKDLDSSSLDTFYYSIKKATDIVPKPENNEPTESFYQRIKNVVSEYLIRLLAFIDILKKDNHAKRQYINKRSHFCDAYDSLIESGVSEQDANSFADLVSTHGKNMIHSLKHNNELFKE